MWNGLLFPYSLYLIHIPKFWNSYKCVDEISYIWPSQMCVTRLHHPTATLRYCSSRSVLYPMVLYAENRQACCMKCKLWWLSTKWTKHSVEIKQNLSILQQIEREKTERKRYIKKLEMSNKGLIFKIYSELLKLNNNKNKTWFKSEQRTWTLFSKENIQMAISTWKDDQHH